jgi:hypothetical protein
LRNQVSHPGRSTSADGFEDVGLALAREKLGCVLAFRLALLRAERVSSAHTVISSSGGHRWMLTHNTSEINMIKHAHFARFCA